ncbi:MAG TPA: aminoglycoside phosphotransferase family protein [Bacilli bacterium]|nr:aminoglycoside phosphotransferase family protein [Bacilli bacterium]
MDRREVRELLARNGFSVQEVVPIVGGYAAQLFRVTLAQGERAVYKHFAEGRAEEVGLYERIIPQLSQTVPRLLGVVREQGQAVGMLIEEAGAPLKQAYRQRPLLEKKSLLRATLDLLADLHVQLAEVSAVWVGEGITAVYPYASSEAWAREGLVQVEQGMAAGIRGLEERVLLELHDIAARFYERYPAWTAGATTFTHGDPHLENILLQDGRMRLIDWEWACVAIPQRDVAVLLQDVLEEELYEWAYGYYRTGMTLRGWHDVGESFEVGYRATTLDNTLMMLGWEIGKHLNGHLTKAEIEYIVDIKVARIRTNWMWLKDKG